MKSSNSFRAELRLLPTDEGGRHTGVGSGSWLILDFRLDPGLGLFGARIEIDKGDWIEPGQSCTATLTPLVTVPAELHVGRPFDLWDGRVVGSGMVLPA